MENPYNYSFKEINSTSKKIRQNIIKMNSNAGAGHTGADLSEIDILASLYFHLLRYDPKDITNPERDRFILSKGHGVGGLYCTLEKVGLIKHDDLLTYLKADSILPGHPVRQKTPGIEMNTGALGHGFPVANGLSLAAKKTNKNYRTYVLTGDGELDEGSNWEAAMAAAHFKLDNLVLIIDRNSLQLADRTKNIMSLEPLQEKLKAFGFDVYSIDGNNPEEIITTIESLDFSGGEPHAIIANTTKGKGVSFIEDKPAWHHKVPVGDEIRKAIEELE